MVLFSTAWKQNQSLVEIVSHGLQFALEVWGRKRLRSKQVQCSAFTVDTWQSRPWHMYMITISLSLLDMCNVQDGNKRQVWLISRHAHFPTESDTFKHICWSAFTVMWDILWSCLATTRLCGGFHGQGYIYPLNHIFPSIRWISLFTTCHGFDWRGKSETVVTSLVWICLMRSPSLALLALKNVNFRQSSKHLEPIAGELPFV
jgi:hypothetical protein